MTTKILIKTSNALPDAFMECLMELPSMFVPENISVEINKDILQKDVGIRILILEPSELLPKQIKELVHAVLDIPGRPNKIKICLEDKDKIFFLPDDIEECADWFKVD